jgi:ABC-2 type transport system ATP-binding protein
MITGTPQAVRPIPSARSADSDSSSSGTPAVEARRLTKLFGTNRAVDAIDLTVMEGEIFGVLGPNGAGKTTMLNMLATLLPIDGGEARIFGYDVRSQGHAVRQLIGVTGQFASVDENLTARENLWLFGRLQGLSTKTAHGIGDDLLAQFDLTELTALFPSSPVACAGALISQPA